MEPLTPAVSLKCSPPTWTGSPNAISSPASEAGRSPCSSQEWIRLDLFGPDPALVSHSVMPGSGLENSTNATSGQPSTASSRSAILQSSLESRLRARLHCNGSMEYSLTWKVRTTPARRRICALRAQARKQTSKSSMNLREQWSIAGKVLLVRRTSDSDFSGWPTPMANKLTPQTREDFTPNLAAVALLAGWCSPTAQDGSRGSLPPRPQDTGVPLSQQAAMAGWCSPSARDWKDTPGMATTGVNPDGSTRNRMDQLPRQAAGAISTSCPAQTEKRGESRGALNPVLSCWMMGYSTEWLMCLQNTLRKL